MADTELELRREMIVQGAQRGLEHVQSFTTLWHVVTQVLRAHLTPEQFADIMSQHSAMPEWSEDQKERARRDVASGSWELVAALAWDRANGVIGG